MKSTTWIYFFFLALGMLSRLAAEQKPDAQGGAIEMAAAIRDPQLSPAIDAVVDDLIAKQKLAGAVTLISQGGKIRHLQAHGVRWLSGEVPMTIDTIFRIHSMSKAIVSAAALQQWERGKYQLDDKIAEYIPAFQKLKILGVDGRLRPPARPVTVEDLFRHTSGFAYDFTAPPAIAAKLAAAELWEGGDGSSEQFCERLAEIPLLHEPGEAWTYGVSTDVLGRLVEVWTGQDLDEYLQHELFEPLGMKDTGFWLDSDSKVTRFAGMHYATVSDLIPGNDPFGRSHLERPKMLSGGGGLLSTARDYHQFLKMISKGGALDGRTYLKPETVAMMTSNRLPESIGQIAFGAAKEEKRFGTGFCLGFSVITGESDDWDADAKVGEYGWGGAASCHYWVCPQDDNLIVITLEQTMPYNWNLERGLKGTIYRLIE